MVSMSIQEAKSAGIWWAVILFLGASGIGIWVCDVFCFYLKMITPVRHGEVMNVSRLHQEVLSWRDYNIITQCYIANGSMRSPHASISVLNMLSVNRNLKHFLLLNHISYLPFAKHMSPFTEQNSKSSAPYGIIKTLHHWLTSSYSHFQASKSCNQWTSFCTTFRKAQQWQGQLYSVVWLLISQRTAYVFGCLQASCQWGCL